ncbi:MAG: hypothetical protein GY911_00865 [Actinomycetales bacterium]|nr:hypothetical protein [Actinomycetales bacterium]
MDIAVDLERGIPEEFVGIFVGDPPLEHGLVEPAHFTRLRFAARVLFKKRRAVKYADAADVRAVTRISQNVWPRRSSAGPSFSG